MLDIRAREGAKGGPILEPTNTRLPATIQQAEVVTVDQRSPHVVPALVTDLGDEAAWRYVEFFTANIRNPNTCRAYLRACSNQFLGGCEDRSLTLAAIRPHDVATYMLFARTEITSQQGDPSPLNLVGHLHGSS
jgi:hypothetical protein